MDDEEDDDVSMADALKEAIADGGVKATDETFALMPGERVVFFLIKHLPGDPGRVLAMQLPSEMAAKLGSALVSCAIMSANLEGEEEELPLPEAPKEEKKKEYLN